MSFALSITFTKLEVSTDQGSSTLCAQSGPGFSQTSSRTVSQTGTPNKNLEATAGLMSLVLFVLALLNGSIEKTLRRPDALMWKAFLHVGVFAAGLVYIAVAAALAGRSASAITDYYEAWLLGLAGGYFLDVLKSLALYYIVTNCACSSEADINADADTELGDMAPSTVMATQPGLGGNDPNDLPSGWTSGTDPESGGTYCVDSNTQTTHWTPPVTADGGSGSTPSSTGREAEWGGDDGHLDVATAPAAGNTTPLQTMLVELGLHDEVADALADEGVDSLETLGLYSQAELEGVGIKRGHAKMLLAQCAAVSTKPQGSGDVAITATTVANTAFTSVSPARKMKPADDANARCPKCASKLAFCICNDAETRRRTMTMSTKCQYAAGGRTCSKPAMKAKSYCVFHSCKHQGCLTPKSSKVEFCPEHAQTQA